MSAEKRGYSAYTEAFGKTGTNLGNTCRPLGDIVEARFSSRENRS